MERQDREALYMILERNGRKRTTEMIELIQAHDFEAVEGDWQELRKNFHRDNCEPKGICFCID